MFEISPEARTKGLEYGRRIYDEIKKNRTGVAQNIEEWSNNVGSVIAQMENNHNDAVKEGNKFLAEKCKDALERLSFEAAELSELSDLIRDKGLLELAKKSAKTIAGVVITGLLKFA